MSIAHSRLTTQGQISVPARVRKRLGVGPGSVLEWAEEDGEIVVRKAGRYTLSDTRAALNFEQRPRPRTGEALKAGIRKLLRARHARG